MLRAVAGLLLPALALAPIAAGLAADADSPPPAPPPTETLRIRALAKEPLALELRVQSEPSPEMRTSGGVVAYAFSLNASTSVDEALAWRVAEFPGVDALDIPQAEQTARRLIVTAKAAAGSDAHTVSALLFLSRPPDAPEHPEPAPADPPTPNGLLVVVGAHGNAAVYAVAVHVAPAPEAPTLAAAPVVRPSRRDERVAAAVLHAESAASPPWLVGLVAAALLASAAAFAWRGGAGALAVGLFSRYNRDSVLGHARRAELYECVRAEPGIPFGVLRARLGLVPGVAQHHLRLLEIHELVRRVRDGRLTRLYPAGMRVPPAPLGAAARVVRELEREPGLTAAELAARLGHRVQSTWEHLRRLRDRGLVAPERAGRAFRWRLAGPA